MGTGRKLCPVRDTRSQTGPLESGILLVADVRGTPDPRRKEPPCLDVGNIPTCTDYTAPKNALESLSSVPAQPDIVRHQLNWQQTSANYIFHGQSSLAPR